MLINTFNVKYRLKARRTKGRLAYEYNPLYNLRQLEEDGEIRIGELKEFRTKRLNFDINHPVNIDVLPSYDGSVNLILNDGKNIPRMINTRFSPRGKNTYEIVDRIGNNDTNIYDDSDAQFDYDTSLYKRVKSIPLIKFKGIIPSGDLKVGNYTFYFKYCDADGNETDFVGESGIVSIFSGKNGDPFSIDGGIRDVNAHKSIRFYISNIDESYDYVKVYYIRSSAELYGNRINLAFKIDKKYTARNGTSNIVINGLEDGILIPISEINTSYFVADTVETQALCQNMLFMANISKPDIPYEDLTDISIRILPYVLRYKSEDLIGNVSPDTYDDQTDKYEYYNVENIYNNVGYWPEELYRFGVVYIMDNGTLSPVFNVRGKNGIPFGSINLNSSYNTETTFFNGAGERQYIPTDEETYAINNTSGLELENAKGVIRFVDKNSFNSDTDYVYSINFHIDDVINTYLKDTLKIRGYFFVRQKRIPTILAQAMVVPLDNHAHIPMIPYESALRDNYNCYVERFIDDSGDLGAGYEWRLYGQKKETGREYAAFCPEFMYNQPYYNQLFTGTSYPIKYYAKGTLNVSGYNSRFYYQDGFERLSENSLETTKIVSVTEDTPSVAIEDIQYKGVVGDASVPYKTGYLETDDIIKNNSDTQHGLRSTNATDYLDAINLARGIWSPYLGMLGELKADNYANIINIYIPGYSEARMLDYFSIRYEDSSAYMAIGERYESGTEEMNYECFRGDSFLCTFTHRVNRNFQDPAAPTNDIMVDRMTWKNNYSSESTDNLQQINIGDVDAVLLGSWITFKVRTSSNLSIRSTDSSNVTETGVNGVPRSFYPLSQLTIEGNNKSPDSYSMNDGFRGTLGEKYNFTLPYVPYLKNFFKNRILYSEIAINDAFRNGYRVFNFDNFQDYNVEYGQIVKLVELNSKLLCVFEHGIALLPINEKALLQNIESGTVAIKSNKVLPEEISQAVITDMYGSQWEDSIIKTPYYVYGVDTVAKKIWRVSAAGQFQVISDLVVNKFLVDNMNLSERELTPTIGIRDVKSHYNANKGDIMFTFYDPKEEYDDEYVWSLCYNENLGDFVTFYSWVPSDSANIDNMMYTFDRQTSRDLAGIMFNDGIDVDSHILKENTPIMLLGVANRVMPADDNRYTLSYEYELVPKLGDNKYFRIRGENHDELTFNGFKQYIFTDNMSEFTGDIDLPFTSGNYWCQYIDTWTKGYNEFLVDIKKINTHYGNVYIGATEGDPGSIDPLGIVIISRGSSSSMSASEIEQAIFAEWDTTEACIFLMYEPTEQEREDSQIRITSTVATTDIDKIFKTFINVKVTATITKVDTDKVVSNYLSKWGPYEGNNTFDIGTIKCALYLITKDCLNEYNVKLWKHGSAGIIDTHGDIKPCNWYGEQHPFEFEFVVRDTPNVAKIFDNLEIISNKAEPESFHFEVVGESYDFSDDKDNMYYRQEATKQLFNTAGSAISYDEKYTKIKPVLRKKSSIFPLYYRRWDKTNQIYDNYAAATETNKDFRNLSGSELVWDEQLAEYKIWTHIQNKPITGHWILVTKEEYDEAFSQNNTYTPVYGEPIKLKKEPDGTYWMWENVGRMRGNSQYLEDRWKILIPSVIFHQKNEDWSNTPPIVIDYIPNDITENDLRGAAYTFYEEMNQYVTVGLWTNRKEFRLRDKYVKIRVRYSGRDLAIITGILTTYTESFA